MKSVKATVAYWSDKKSQNVLLILVLVVTMTSQRLALDFEKEDTKPEEVANHLPPSL